MAVARLQRRLFWQCLEQETPRQRLMQFRLSDAKIVNGTMNEFPCATIVDCHGNKHFSVLMENTRKVGEVRMSYTSPIELIQQQTRHQIDECILKAVINVGVNVDKEELIKALAYDRGQYQKGYDDRDAEIIRCKDYIHWAKGYTEECCNVDSVCFHNGWCKPDWYCADGKRK